jgi:RNA polymerase sigma factor (sigma-70 family)
MTEEFTSGMQRCLDRFRGGERDACAELFQHTCERLRQLAHVMLKGYPRLKRWEETDDILQSALLRLYRTLQQVAPVTPRDYYRLATLQIRRELIDLVRHHYGPQGPGAHHQTNAKAMTHESAPPAYERSDLSSDPGRLALWSEFHRLADALPPEEREAFDLLWYQGLKPDAAAALLDVSARTVRRRMLAAMGQLHEALGGRLPIENGTP